MSTLRLAVIGAGHLGRIHARLASDLPDTELVGVVDPRPAVRNEVADELGTVAYAGAEELLGKIDAAIVATPTATHHEVAMTLLERGIHVLVEKPITATLAEADELVETAQQNGALLQVGHVERFNPALARVAPHVEDPKYIDAVRMSGYPFRSTDIGVVHDLMIHDLDVVLSLVRSSAVKVEALGVSVLGGHEDVANARVVFANGCVANFTASRVSYRSERSMQIWSGKAFASIDFGLRRTTVVRPSEPVLNRSVDVDSLSAEATNRLKRHLFDEMLHKQTVDGAEGNALADEQRDLVESIRSGRPPRVTGEQARDALALAEQIQEAIQSHSWDGHESGRFGPIAMPATPILRARHWDAADEAPAPRREAG